MPQYTRVQAGHVIYLALMAALVVTAAIMWLVGEPWLIVVTTAICLPIAILFGSLTVWVDDEEVGLRFGPGPIGRQWPLDEIESADAVRNPWYTGWGIRYLPGATVYNVSGFDAVEIRLKNGKRYRIGTDDPMRLEATIRSRAGLRPPAG